jgi:hypothetical protein
MSVEYGRDPVVALQHLARNLRIARFVYADEPDKLQPENEKKSAEGKESKSISGTAGAFAKVGSRSQEYYSIGRMAPCGGTCVGCR